MIGCPLETQYLQGFQGLHRENRATHPRIDLSSTAMVGVDFRRFSSLSTLEREVFLSQDKKTVVA